MSSAGVASTTSVVALAAASVAAVSVAAYAVYQQRSTFFRMGAYSRFERKYAAQLRDSRQRMTQRNSLAVADTEAQDSAGGGVEVSTTARIKVIYGSDAGNAEAFARGLVMELRDRGASAALIDPARWAYLDRYKRDVTNAEQKRVLFDFPLGSAKSDSAPAAAVSTALSTSSTDSQRQKQEITALPREILVFIVSTAGEGDPPGNFQKLFQEMRSAVTTVAERHKSSPAQQRQGEKSDSSAPTSAGVFDGVAYAVFALGDSSYKYYCRCGTSVATMLKSGGGHELHRTGFGDARDGAAGQEDRFDEWQEGLLLALSEKAGVVLSQGSLDPPKPQTRLEVFPIPAADTVEAAAANLTVADPSPFPPPPLLFGPSLHRPALLRLTRCEQLTPVRDDDGSAILRLSFALGGANVHYQAGDHLGIFPANPDTAVARCAALLQISEETLATPIELREDRTRTSSHNTLPARVPLRTALTHYVDLCGRPKKSALRVLAKYCADDAEKRAFLAAIDGQGRQTQDGASSSHGGRGASSSTTSPRTALDFMERYSSCGGRVRVGHFLEVMPRIQPRYYSAGTDQSTHPEEIQIYVRALKDGLASNYLSARVPTGEPQGVAASDCATPSTLDASAVLNWRDPSRVFAFVRPSTFHLPAALSPSAPVLMIGPGTGAAAMVGLLYRREALMRRKASEAWGDCRFFFGARHASSEYFIRDEVTRWSLAPREMAALDEANPDAPVAAALRHARDRHALTTSVVTELACAFSRDQPSKVYVTDLIATHADVIYNMIMSSKESLIFLSGDAAFMAKDVDRALVKVIQSKGEGRLSALAVLQSMEREHRYLKDVY